MTYPPSPSPTVRGCSRQRRRTPPTAPCLRSGREASTGARSSGRISKARTKASKGEAKGGTRMRRRDVAVCVYVCVRVSMPAAVVVVVVILLLFIIIKCYY